ncbi:hypothetical protein BGZ79_002701 [Entomortierella chlamydospora]|nr:hypothetical protein BGZ79_002701 [Entomortierella chlamydospora]
MPPLVLQARADLRNLIIWLCSPLSSIHIDGKGGNGEDAEARKAQAADAKVLFNHGTDLKIKDIWGSQVGQLAMEYLKVYWKVFTDELIGLAWKRVDEGKEILIDELRSAIGLPASAGSILNNISYPRVHHQDQLGESKEPEEHSDVKEESPMAMTTADQISKPIESVASVQTSAVVTAVGTTQSSSTSKPGEWYNHENVHGLVIDGLIDGVKSVLSENMEAALNANLNPFTVGAILRKEDGSKENSNSAGEEMKPITVAKILQACMHG